MKRGRILGTAVLAMAVMLGGTGFIPFQGKAHDVYFTPGARPPAVQSAGYTGGFGTCTEGKCVEQWQHNKKGQKFAQTMEKQSKAEGMAPLQAPSCSKCG